MRKLRGFFRLNGEDRTVLLQALGLFIFVRIARRFMRFQRLQVFLGYLPFFHRSRTTTEETAPRAQRIARFVSHAAHYGPHDPTCLERSLVLWALLRRKGIPSEIWVGASKVDGEFAAHAWVEQGGRVLNDSADVRERFVPLSRISNLEPVNET